MRIYYVDEDQKASEIFQKLGGYAVPQFYFVDSEGTVVKELLGFPGEVEFNKVVKELTDK